MENPANNGTVPFEQLPMDEKIMITASSKLIKHFRGMENAGLMDKETASNLIGCVKKMVSVSTERKLKIAELTASV